MNTQICTIDNGYYSTVCYQHPNKTISFRSKVQPTNSPSISSNNTYYLQLQNQSYLVGEAAETIDIDLDKSHSQLHLLTTLTALGAKSFHESSFKIVANCPLSLFTKSNKKSLEDNLKSQKNVRFRLNGTDKLVSILDCLVYPQALPVLYVNTINAPIIAIVDIGGLTAQGCMTQNKNLIPSSVFTENLGTLILLASVKKALNSKYNINLQDYLMEDILKNGLKSDKQGSLQIIKETCREHMEKIVRAMKLNGWDVKNVLILFTGGGALLLEEYIPKFFPNYCLSENALMDNAKGLWEVAKFYYGF